MPRRGRRPRPGAYPPVPSIPRERGNAHAPATDRLTATGSAPHPTGGRRGRPGGDGPDARSARRRAARRRRLSRREPRRPAAFPGRRCAELARDAFAGPGAGAGGAAARPRARGRTARPGARAQREGRPRGAARRTGPHPDRVPAARLVVRGGRRCRRAPRARLGAVGGTVGGADGVRERGGTAAGCAGGAARALVRGPERHRPHPLRHRRVRGSPRGPGRAGRPR